MISDSSAISIDALGLSGSDGLFLLISRSLDRLKPGAVLEISSDNPSVDHDLPAWSRFTANRYVGKSLSNGRAVHRIEKGFAARILTDCDLDWDNRAKITNGHFDTRAWLIGRTAVIREEALRSDGFAPRGATVETGSPEFPFDVIDRTMHGTKALRIFTTRHEAVTGTPRAIFRGTISYGSTMNWNVLFAS